MIYSGGGRLSPRTPVPGRGGAAMRRSRVLISPSAGFPRAMTTSAFSAFSIDAGASEEARRASCALGDPPRKLAQRATRWHMSPRLAAVGARVRESPSMRFRIGGMPSIVIGRLAYISGRVHSTRLSLRVARGEAPDESARRGLGVMVCGCQARRQSRPVKWEAGRVREQNERCSGVDPHYRRPMTSRRVFPGLSGLALNRPRRATAKEWWCEMEDVALRRVS